MLTVFPICVLVGTILGFLAGLGVGGGSLLILWLTLVLHMNPQTARGINLLFFLPSAGIALLYRKQQGTLPFQKLIPAIASGCGAALLLSWLGTMIQVTSFKKLFGILLLITGIRELCYRPRKFK